MEKTIIILGPTAVGKTEVSILLAERIGGEIISADAFQVYRGMDIATANPVPSDLSRVPHHLVNILEPIEQYNAARFRERAISLINEIRSRSAVPIVVGGAGMYIRVLVDGLFDAPPADPVYQDFLRREEEEKGPGYLHRLLLERDPVAARRIHPNNLKRLVRALEVMKATGCPISQLQTQWRINDERPTSNDLPRSVMQRTIGVSQDAEKQITVHCPLPAAYSLIGLRRDREELYERINLRVERMFDQGLVEETKQLLDQGAANNRIAWQTLGYREVEGYLAGDYPRGEAVRRLARNTRHYAKRQITWWRRDERIHWIDIQAGEEPADVVEKILLLKNQI